METCFIITVCIIIFVIVLYEFEYTFTKWQICVDYNISFKNWIKSIYLQ